MDSPRTAAWISETNADPTDWPEYSRKDDALSYRPEQPVLASNEWPERERPDLYYPRRITIGTRADEITFFDYDSRFSPYSRYGWSAYRVWTGPYNVGTYGFWR